MLNDMGFNGNGAEIGVASGKFSEIWVRDCNLKTIFLIDPWKEYSYGEYRDGNNLKQNEQDKRFLLVKEKMSRYGDRVKILRKTSLEAVNKFANDFFDFVYIDANHEYKRVKEDIEAWYPKVKIGGIFSGHDYVNSIGRRTNRFGELSICEVKTAVDEFAASKNVKVYVTGGSYRIPPSWFIIKG